MSTLVYTTQKDFEGPWLLDRNALLSLGTSLKDISERLDRKAERGLQDELSVALSGYSEESQEALREEIRGRINERLKLRRNVKILLSDSRSIHDETIEQLLLNPELEDEAPVGMEIEISASYCSANLKLGAGTYGGTHLDIRTAPETDETAREAFVILEQWAITNQSPYWLRLWKKVTPGHWLIFFIAIILLSNLSLSIEDQVRQIIDPKVKELLVDGISTDEISKALELILRYKVEDIPQQVEPNTTSLYELFLFGGVAICTVLTICPGVVIGIGRNKMKLGLWRVWTKLVGISMPTLIGTTIIWPYFTELIGKYF